MDENSRTVGPTAGSSSEERSDPSMTRNFNKVAAVALAFITAGAAVAARQLAGGRGARSSSTRVPGGSVS